MALNEFSIPAYIIKALKDLGYTPDTSMDSYIQKSWDWYTRNDDFYKVSDVNADGKKSPRKRLSTKPAKRVSKEWASLLLNEDTIISVESTHANNWLSNYLETNNFWPNGQMIVEKAFALGTAAWALWFDVSDIKTDIKIRRYDARMIVPLSWDEEGITECAFVTRTSIKGQRCDQLQIHTYDVETGTYHIITKMWIKEKEINYEAHGIIEDFDTGCETKTFGIIKPGEENTVVDLSPFGMSIFEDAIDAIKAVDLTFDMIFREVELTGVMVFADEQLLDVQNKNGKAIPMSKMEKSLFRKLIGTQAKDLIDIFSPDIRIEPLSKAFNLALAELGDTTGFGEQYFKLDKNGGLKTATEVTSDNSALMRNIKKHENVLRVAIQDIITALLTCARIHMGITIEEDFGPVKVEFDDSIIIDSQAEKTQMIMEINAGVIQPWRYGVAFYGLTPEEAQAEIPPTIYEEGM